METKIQEYFKVTMRPSIINALHLWKLVSEAKLMQGVDDFHVDQQPVSEGDQVDIGAGPIILESGYYKNWGRTDMPSIEATAPKFEKLLEKLKPSLHNNDPYSGPALIDGGFVSSISLSQTESQGAAKPMPLRDIEQHIKRALGPKIAEQLAFKITEPTTRGMIPLDSTNVSESAKVTFPGSIIIETKPCAYLEEAVALRNRVVEAINTISPPSQGRC